MLHSGGFHLRLEMSEPGFVCVCFRKPLWERKWLRQHGAVCGKDWPTLLWPQPASLITTCCDSSSVSKTHPHLSTRSAFINDATVLWCSDRRFCRRSKFAFNCGWMFCLLQSTPSSAPTVIHTKHHRIFHMKNAICCSELYQFAAAQCFFLQQFWYFIIFLIEFFLMNDGCCALYKYVSTRDRKPLRYWMNSLPGASVAGWEWSRKWVTGGS